MFLLKEEHMGVLWHIFSMRQLVYRLEMPFKESVGFPVLTSKNVNKL